MTQSEFIDLFKDSFDELATAIESNTLYKEIDEWTSMQALILIAHIDDSVGVVLSADDLKNTHTVDELYQCVKRQL
ncbi:MAG: hypothetical protein ACPG4Z_02725 [Chitinophagales bacterium]